jgi:hypothetical protein
MLPQSEWLTSTQMTTNAGEDVREIEHFYIVDRIVI